jgi:hypothetical protein
MGGADGIGINRGVRGRYKELTRCLPLDLVVTLLRFRTLFPCFGFVDHARLGFPGGLDICDVLKDPSLGPCPEAHASHKFIECIASLLAQPITTRKKTIDKYTPGPLKPLFTSRFVTT